LKTTARLVVAFVLSLLDNRNSLLSGLLARRPACFLELITSCHNWRLFIGSRFIPELTSKHLLTAVSMAWRPPTSLSWSVSKYQDVLASVHRPTIWSWSSLQPEWKHEGDVLSRAMLPEFGTTYPSLYGLFLLFPVSVRSSRHIFLNLLSNNRVCMCVPPSP